MTTELQTKLERIKEQCRKAIELGEAATAGPWTVYCTSNDGQVLLVRGTTEQDKWTKSTQIAATDGLMMHHARTFSPAAAKALLVAIEALEVIAERAFGGPCIEARVQLEQICREWPE